MKWYALARVPKPITNWDGKRVVLCTFSGGRHACTDLLTVQNIQKAMLEGFGHSYDYIIVEAEE